MKSFFILILNDFETEINVTNIAKLNIVNYFLFPNEQNLEINNSYKLLKLKICYFITAKYILVSTLS